MYGSLNPRLLNGKWFIRFEAENFPIIPQKLLFFFTQSQLGRLYLIAHIDRTEHNNKTRFFLCFYTFWRLLDWIEAKTKWQKVVARHGAWPLPTSTETYFGGFARRCTGTWGKRWTQLNCFGENILWFFWIYRVFMKNFVLFTNHCNLSLAYIAVKDCQSSQRNASVQSLLLAGHFLYNQ